MEPGEGEGAQGEERERELWRCWHEAARQSPGLESRLWALKEHYSTK